ncbi:hypothetical protein OW493_16760, partial [Cobetia sp. 14N.309.X.WAT.E.A4]|uniref:hypothetical protein n=1 Tax=Cobetia sp. 14N.309.X.WAT.E.A4 TaxID=2998323 RepID=UPI0025AFD2EA
CDPMINSHLLYQLSYRGTTLNTRRIIRKYSMASTTFGHSTYRRTRSIPSAESTSESAHGDIQM